MGSSVRLVLSDGVRWPEALKWWLDYAPALDQDKSRLIAALSALEDSNENIIRACSDFYLSNAPERLGSSPSRRWTSLTWMRASRGPASSASRA